MEPVFLIENIRVTNFNKDLIIGYVVNDPIIDNVFNNNVTYYGYRYNQTKNYKNLENLSTNFINKCFTNDLYISWDNYLNSSSSGWLSEHIYDSLYYNIVNNDNEFIFNFNTEGRFPYIIKKIVDHINENDNTFWSYKMCVHEIKTYGNEETFSVQFLLSIDTNKLYKSLKSNINLSSIDIDALHFLFFYKNQSNKNNFNPSSDIDPIWKKIQ